MKIFSIILLLLMPTLASADLFNQPVLGTFKVKVMSAWDTSTPKHNKIHPSEKHGIACWVTRDVQNAPIFPEVFECAMTTPKREALGADGDFLILTSQEWIEHFWCSNPLYDNQVDCEMDDCVLDPITNYGSICTQRGTWQRGEKWSD